MQQFRLKKIDFRCLKTLLAVWYWFTESF